MKKILFTIPLLYLLTACPDGLNYTPGKIGTETVDLRLEGTWELDPSTPDHEITKVTFKKQNKFAYQVTVNETGSTYSMGTNNYFMYQTNIDGLNIMYLKPSDEDKYYLYQFDFDGANQLIIGDVSLLDGGIDSLKSTESLRQQIANSKSMEEFKKIEKFVFNKK